MKKTALIILSLMMFSAARPACAEMADVRSWVTVDIPQVCASFENERGQPGGPHPMRIAVYRDSDSSLSEGCSRAEQSDALQFGLSGLLPVFGEDRRRPHWDISEFLTGIINAQSRHSAPPTF